MAHVAFADDQRHRHGLQYQDQLWQCGPRHDHHPPGRWREHHGSLPMPL